MPEGALEFRILEDIARLFQSRGLDALAGEQCRAASRHTRADQFQLRQLCEMAAAGRLGVDRQSWDLPRFRRASRGSDDRQDAELGTVEGSRSGDPSRELSRH